MKTVKTLVAASTISLLALMGAQAHAGGWLADTFIKPFDPNLARQLDQANAQMGRPVERGVAAVADAWVPGAGTALNTAWQIQYSGVLNGPGSGPMPAPGMQMQQMPVAASNVGAFCHTPAGRFGPGPVQGIGAPCWVTLPMGTVYGNVGQ